LIFEWISSAQLFQDLEIRKLAAWCDCPAWFLSLREACRGLNLFKGLVNRGKFHLKQVKIGAARVPLHLPIAVAGSNDPGEHQIPGSETKQKR
jgi:hypothetical protein